MNTSLSTKFRDVSFVTLLVGPDKVAYRVHQSILCSTSKVFKAAFTSNFQEASDKSMSLVEEDMEAVECMIQWLYTGKIEAVTPVSDDTSDKCYWQLAKLNTLADKYSLISLKNGIIDLLFEMQKPSKSIKPLSWASSLTSILILLSLRLSEN